MAAKLKYKFDGKEGDEITKETALRWIDNYRAEHPRKVRAEFFGCELINKVLADKRCKGIRVHYAINDKGGHELLLMGADENGNNLWPTGVEKDGDDGGKIIDSGLPCPPYCPEEE